MPSPAKKTSRSRKIAVIAALVLVAFVAVFLCGPRAPADDTWTPVSVPPLSGLEKYLADSEHAASARYPITPGTEKLIVWAGGVPHQTDIALVYVHGFTATRAEISPVSEMAAERLGANLFMTRLTAHGQGAEPFATVTATDWFTDAREALAIAKTLAHQVYIIGFSTGAPLAVYLAKNDPTIAGLILISPNFAVAQKAAYLMALPWGNLIGEIITGGYLTVQPVSEAERPFWTFRHRIEGVSALMALTGKVSEYNLSAIKVPALFVYTPHDQTVDLGRMQQVYTAWGGAKKIEIIDANQHVLAGNFRNPQNNEKLVELVTSFVTATRAGTPR